MGGNGMWLVVPTDVYKMFVSQLSSSFYKIFIIYMNLVASLNMQGSHAPLTRNEPMPRASVEAQSFNRWTAREFPGQLSSESDTWVQRSDPQTMWPRAII